MKANSFSNTHSFHNSHITNAKGTGALNFPSVGKELPVPPACMKCQGQFPVVTHTSSTPHCTKAAGARACARDIWQMMIRYE